MNNRMPYIAVCKCTQAFALVNIKEHEAEGLKTVYKNFEGLPKCEVTRAILALEAQSMVAYPPDASSNKR